MSAESASGERFARDMRRIREDRNISQDDIHEETRIAITLITAFEQDGLFEHPAFNRVYLRSFVRAYAGCIDIDPELALTHLERALSGEYENELAARILDTTPSMGGYDPDESTSSAESATDTPESSSTMDRPLSRQEQEPPTFSPRPVGSDPRETTDENDSEDKTKDETVREESAVDHEAIGADEDLSGEDLTEEDLQEEDESSDDASKAATDHTDDHQEAPTHQPSGRSEEKKPADEPLKKDTSAEDADSEAEDDDDHSATDESSAPGERRSGRMPGTAGGTVFNKRPMGSGDNDRDTSAADESRDGDTEGTASRSSPSELSVSETNAPGKTTEAESTDDSGDGDGVKDHGADDDTGSDEDDASDELSPAQRFRQATEGDADGPPPPPQGEMVGKPRPVGSATDTTRTARDSPRSPMESPMAARSEKERADRDLRVSEVLEENRTLLVSGAAVVGILIVGLALWFAFAGDSETPSVSPTTDAKPSQTPDPSTQESEAPSTEAGTTSASRSPLANLALGDTLQLVVEAESDVLGMRIQRDGDARRPYWINEGETMAFPFTDRVIVWDNIQNVDLYLERHRYPEGQHLDARGRVVITRDSAEVFADTVRGTEASFPTPTIRPLDETFPDPEETEDEPEEESVPVNEGGAANEDAAADTTTPDVSPEDTTQSEAASPSDTTSAPNGTSASNGNSSSDGVALNMLR